MWALDYKEGWTLKSWCFWNMVLEKTLESPLGCKIKPVHPGSIRKSDFLIFWYSDIQDSWSEYQWIFRKSVLNIHWKDWCWSWSSSTLATWHEELIHWRRPWCWERLKAGGERDNWGLDGWMTSLTESWVWANSGRWWRTGKPGVLQSMGVQRVRLNWTATNTCFMLVILLTSY